jgi:predicted branched-subunit amino acid permease
MRTPDTVPPSEERAAGHDAAAAFVRGFVGLLPLWAGAIPAGMAFGVAARAAGLGPAEAQLMSLVVFSAAAQVGAAALLGAGAPIPVLVGTAMALNAQLFLLGLAAGRQLRLSWPRRLVAAWFLTDGAFGVAAGLGPLRPSTLVGAGVSMYVAWNGGTALGSVVGQAIPDPARLGIDLVATLTFLAVLAPLVRSRPALVAALAAGGATLLLARVVPAGLAVLGAGVVGCAAGGWSARRAAADSEGRRDRASPRAAAHARPATHAREPDR